MGFWIFMLIMVMLIPCTFICFGYLFLKKAPDKINSVFGYRTKRSMRNKETWVFAHNYIGKLWLVCGIISLPISVVSMLLLIGKNDDLIGMIGAIIEGIQIILMILTILLTERALKKNYG